MSWRGGERENTYGLGQVILYISGHRYHQALSAYYASGRAACPASPISALLSSSREQIGEKKHSELKYANIALWLLVKRREVKQLISKTLLGDIDIVVGWVGFELSQEREEAEGGERLLAAQSVIMLKWVQQMFIPQAGTTSACSGHLGLKPKISAISSECICWARGDIHQHRQLLRFQQELIYHPPASITSNDPN